LGPREQFLRYRCIAKDAQPCHYVSRDRGLFKTFFILGCLIGGVLVIGSFFIKKPDEEMLALLAKELNDKKSENSDNDLPEIAKTAEKKSLKKRDWTLFETVN
jgi:hypothetical protein